LYGTGTARPLNQQGDYFKLIFHGLNYDGSDNGKSVEHILAIYEGGQLHQSAEWKWVDLSALGEIGGLYCTMETSDTGTWGPNTPVYFCMDKLQVKIKGTSTFVEVTNIINVPDKAIAGIPLLLTGTVIPENATNQTITWSISDAGTTGATISPAGGGNDWNFTAAAAGTSVVTATIENGKAEGVDYVQDFEIFVKEIIGIGTNNLNEIKIYSYQNTISIKNETNVPLKSVEIFDRVGQLVFQKAVNDVEIEIILNLTTGIYFAKLILQNDTTITKKFTLQSLF
jgi:hypothetical protein